MSHAAAPIPCSSDVHILRPVPTCSDIISPVFISHAPPPASRLLPHHSLVSPSPPPSTLVCTPRWGDIEILRAPTALTDHGANMNARTGDYWTPAYHDLSAHNGCFGLVEP